MAASFNLQSFKESSSRALDKAKSALTGQEQQAEEEDETVEAQQSRLDELAQYCPQLSFQQRLIGFAVSFTLGYLIALFSFSFFRDLVFGNPIPFALNYSLGHVCQLLSSTFLCGPRLQFRNMFDEKRRLTSVTYLSCLVATLIIIFIPLPSALKLITLVLLMLTQCTASIWYTLSYIPYGRKTCWRLLTRTLGLDEKPDYSGITLTGLTGTA